MSASIIYIIFNHLFQRVRSRPNNECVKETANFVSFQFVRGDVELGKLLILAPNAKLPRR